jgi:hypothetical protein
MEKSVRALTNCIQAPGFGAVGGYRYFILAIRIVVNWSWRGGITAGGLKLVGAEHFRIFIESYIVGQIDFALRKDTYRYAA